MNPDTEMLRRIAVVNHYSASVNAIVAGMVAENDATKSSSYDGQGVAHDEAAFASAILNTLNDQEFAHMGVFNFLNWQGVYMVSD